MIPPSSFLAQALSWDWMWIETSSDADCDDKQLWGLGNFSSNTSIGAKGSVDSYRRKAVYEGVEPAILVLVGCASLKPKRTPR